MYATKYTRPYSTVLYGTIYSTMQYYITQYINRPRYWKGACLETSWLGVPARLCWQVHYTFLLIASFCVGLLKQSTYLSLQRTPSFKIIIITRGLVVGRDSETNRNTVNEIKEAGGEDEQGNNSVQHNQLVAIIIVWQVLLGLSSVMWAREKRWLRWLGIFDQNFAK